MHAFRRVGVVVLAVLAIATLFAAPTSATTEPELEAAQPASAGSIGPITYLVNDCLIEARATPVSRGNRFVHDVEHRTVGGDCRDQQRARVYCNWEDPLAGDDKDYYAEYITLRLTSGQAVFWNDTFRSERECDSLNVVAGKLDDPSGQRFRSFARSIKTDRSFVFGTDLEARTAPQLLPPFRYGRPADIEFSGDEFGGWYALSTDGRITVMGVRPVAGDEERDSCPVDDTVIPDRHVDGPLRERAVDLMVLPGQGVMADDELYMATSSARVASVDSPSKPLWGFPSTQRIPLAGPVVGAAATPTFAWLVAADGGMFSFRDGSGPTRFFGSAAELPLVEPIVGMAPTGAGDGYWLVASDGGIFAYGEARFRGSMGGRQLNAPVVGMVGDPGGNGYLMVASDGGIFNFGDANFWGSLGGQELNSPVVAVGVHPNNLGYVMIQADGSVTWFGVPFTLPDDIHISQSPDGSGCVLR